MKIKKQFLNKVVALFVSTTLVITPSAYAAGMQSQLNNMFDSMTNITQPGVFETQRRGVISGGRGTVKNKLFNENLINFTPPSWKAGCGGIDLFGGSFSFINSEQLTQLLRSIAANAVGYAFHLAISTICESCAKILETLQKKIQELNQFMGNSCQLAQGIVNDVAPAFAFGKEVKGKSDATVMGFFDDFFASWSEKDGKGATEKIAQNAPEKLDKGNIVWRQLQRSNAAAWFRSGDNQLLESIMSITGSVVIQEPGDEGAENDEQTITDVPGNKLSLSDLIHGGSDVVIYSCSSDYDLCMKPTNQTINLIGIKEQLENAFLGASNLPGTGLIGKYATDNGVLTDTEAALAANLEMGLGSLIFQLAKASESVARSFIQQHSGAIAAQMAYSVALESIRAVRAAMGGEDSAYVVKVNKTITESSRHVESEYKTLVDRYGTIAQAINTYNNLMVSVRQHELAPARLKVTDK